MASEVIKLNLIPSGEMPTFHCSQFDNGREILIDLFNGEDEYSLPGGYTAELHTRKMDNNIVTLATTTVSSNHLTFTSTEQLTACAGNNLSEVSIKDASDYVVGTLNFWLYVEKDPLQGGLTSTSSIHDLTDQIEEITTEIVGENYYNKTETDDLLDLKADKSTTYTKTEVNTLLNSKADASSVYTKSETNTLLSAKADASDVYTKSQVETKLAVKADANTVYTKSQTDTLLSDKADKSDTYTKSQVDSKLSLKADKATTYTKTQVDDALALKANSADLATVATTGDYDDLLNKPSIPAAQVQSDYAQSDNTKVDYIKNKPDIEGMIADALLEVMPVDTASGPIATFDTELAVPLVNVSCDVVATGGNGTPTTPIPIVGYSQAVITANGDDITIAFGQTVYGGVLDVTNGTLTVDCMKATFDLSQYTPTTANGYDSYLLTLTHPTTDSGGSSYKKLCNVCDRYSWSGSTVGYEHFYIGGANAVIYLDENTYRSGTVEFSYPLATPVTLTLTSEQIRAIVGTNNVYSDTNGNTTVKFKDSIQHYIDTHTGG